MSSGCKHPSVVGLMISSNKPEKTAYDNFILQSYSGEYVPRFSVRPAEKLVEHLATNIHLNASKHREEQRPKLLAEHPKAEYFFLVDDDVVVPGTAVEQLLSHDKPVVGGIYQRGKGKNNRVWVAGRWDTAQASSVHAGKFVHFKGDLEPGLLETDMVGLGCVLIRRDIFEQVSFNPGLTRIKNTDGSRMLMGECLKWTGDAQQICGSVYADTNVMCAHVKRRNPVEPCIEH